MLGAKNIKVYSIICAKPRLALAGGAFACVRTVSVFEAIQKHDRSEHVKDRRPSRAKLVDQLSAHVAITQHLLDDDEQALAAASLFP